MSKVITFSRYFPSYHPRKGEPTYFLEKIYKSLYLMKSVPKELVEAFNFKIMNDDNISAKHHTIRAGNRWKVGDKFSPRVWSGKPYCSKQITIAPDVEIKKVWSVIIDTGVEQWMDIWVNGNSVFYGNIEIPKNDGLSIEDFFDWFHNPKKIITQRFEGQIICWNGNIIY